MLFPRLAEPDDRLALRVGDDSLSARQLASACASHVERLRELGLEPGDRIGVWTHPSLATCAALAAHAAGGFVSVPLNPKLGTKELAYVLGDSRPRLIVSTADSVPETSHPILRFRVEPSARPLEVAPVDESPMLVIYTSGTTGPPKGVVLSRRNVAANLDALADAWAWTAHDTIVHALPLFHVHGLVLGLFGPLRRGGAMHALARFEPADLGRAIASAERGVLFAVPTMYHRLAEAAHGDASLARDLAKARLLVSGSAGLPVREHRRIAELTGRNVVERYGLTETLINTAVRADEGHALAGSVGGPLRGVELRLVDDARRPIDASDEASIGEVAVRGPNVFGGYLGRPDATAEVIDQDGFFYTGDLATRAKSGAIRIVGRRSTDLIKTGGFKVGAAEVEAALLEHPEVAEAAVIGVPDDDLGERIVAFVVSRGDVEPSALRDHVSAELAPHKRPREVRLVRELPRNAMGKILKSELRTKEARS